jgi:prepilin peptidase CpaA
MWGLEPITAAIVAGYAALLIIAAVSDVARRRIPNWTVLGLLVLFAAWLFVRPGTSLTSAFAGFGVAFAVSVGLYLIRWVGAGDSKLFSAVALFAGLNMLPTLVMATTLTGGAIVIGALILNPKRAGRGLTAKGRAEARGVPYGVAIAMAGLLLMFAPSIGLLNARDAYGLLPAGVLAPVQR